MHAWSLTRVTVESTYPIWTIQFRLLQIDLICDHIFQKRQDLNDSSSNGVVSPLIGREKKCEKWRWITFAVKGRVPPAEEDAHAPKPDEFSAAIFRKNGWLMQTCERLICPSQVLSSMWLMSWNRYERWRTIEAASLWRQTISHIELMSHTWHGACQFVEAMTDPVPLGRWTGSNNCGG